MDYYYLKAANGMTVRVPEDKVVQWQKAQDEIKAGTRKPDPKFQAELKKRMEQFLKEGK